MNTKKTRSEIAMYLDHILAMRKGLIENETDDIMRAYELRFKVDMMRDFIEEYLQILRKKEAKAKDIQ